MELYNKPISAAGSGYLTGLTYMLSAADPELAVGHRVAITGVQSIFVVRSSNAYFWNRNVVICSIGSSDLIIRPYHSLSRGETLLT